MVSTFYIYADGNDLDGIAAEVRSRIEMFVEPYRGRVRVIDQRAEEVSADLPDWNLGVNFEFESLTDAEKKDLLLFFQSLSAEFGRDFVLGGALPHGLSEDFVYVSAAGSLEPAIDLLTANEKGANKSPEPTTTAVMPRAIEVKQPNDARVMTAVVVAHL